jgi:hypothetical protein
MTVAIALVQVSTSHATAPVISNPGDVIIGDLEDRVGTAPNIFVAPDMIAVDSIVSDDTTPDGEIKWSFYSASAAIEINGVGPLPLQGTPGLTVGDDDATSPSVANRIDLTDGDAGGPIDVADSDPRTLTFRNVTLSAGNASAPGPAGEAHPPVVVTLFASDCSTFSQRSIVVYSIRGESDGLSGAGPTVIDTFDFTQSTFGWLGGNSPGFGGTVASGTLGLCMTVPLTGNNLVLWISPDYWVELIDTALYRSRMSITTTQTGVDAIPLFFHTFDSSILAGTAPDGTAYGGFEWLLDVDGGAQGIGRNGDNSADFWWSVNAGGTSQFSGDGSTTGAFTAAADAVNDARQGLQIIDANASLLSDADSGTICVADLEIAAVNRADVQVSSTPFNPVIDSSTHFVQNVFASAGTTIAVDNVNDEIDIDMGTNGDVRVNAGYFNNTLPNLNQQLYPVVWTGDTVYRTRVTIRSTAAGTDPVDAIFLAMDTTNSELGAQSFTTRGPGATPLSLTSSPTTTSAEYDITFSSQNATDSVTADANRLRGFPFFFNTNGLFGAGTGGDAIEIESIEVDILNLN